MIDTVDLQKRFRHAIVPAIGACVFGYFVYHAIQGDRGVLAWLRIGQQLTESRTALAQLTVERESIEKRVSLLNAKGLDTDILEEQARRMLNIADPNDRTVIVVGPEPTHEGSPPAN